jgi:uncharacterized protein (UPF0335 family)
MSNEPEIAGDQLRSIAERIERLDDEIKDLNSDKKEVYAEAKANGYDVAVLRKVIKIRSRDPDERKEEEAILDLYLSAIGDVRTDGHKERPAVVSSNAETQENLYQAAVRLVQADRRASATHLQRRMGIGYVKAKSFIDRMEGEGVVGPANDAGERAVPEPNSGLPLTAGERAAAESFKSGIERHGATVSIEISAGAGSVMARAGEALKAAGVEVKTAKPLVGSFAPPREDPFGGDD